MLVLEHSTELLTDTVEDLEHPFHVTLEATGGGGGGVASRMSPSQPLVPYRIEPGDAHSPLLFFFFFLPLFSPLFLA